MKLTNSSRVNKYKGLREGIKGEAGINRDTINTVVAEEKEDDFLSFINRDAPTPKNVEDTLTEAKTFDQIRQESSKEIDEALKSVKTNVGKEAQYNTRVDILNKIRNPEKEVIHIDKMDDVSTDQFAKGYFVNQEKEEPTIPIDKPFAPKKKMTLMERLASMSPKDDVKKVEEALQQGNTLMEHTVNEPINIEETNSLEDMVNMIKKKDQIEVDKVLQEQQVMSEEAVEEVTKEKSTRVSRVEKTNVEKENILNYVIIALIVVFVVLCVMIFKQIFF